MAQFKVRPVLIGLLAGAAFGISWHVVRPLIQGQDALGTSPAVTSAGDVAYIFGVGAPFALVGALIGLLVSKRSAGD